MTSHVSMTFPIVESYIIVFVDKFLTYLSCLRLYLVVVPTLLHPSTPLVVTMHLYQERSGRGIPIKVTVTLLRGENQLEKTSREILPAGHGQEIAVAVPGHLVAGGQPYSLHLVGEDYHQVEGFLFRHKVPLKIFNPRHIISIYLNSNIFIQNQTGNT